MKHAEKIRQLNCCNCWKEGQTEWAHIRIGSNAGIALKPHDKRTVPLCTKCHREQHRVGELTFWLYDLSAALSYASNMHNKPLEQMKILTWRFYNGIRKRNG